MQTVRALSIVAALLATGWVGGEAGEVAVGPQPRPDRRLVEVAPARWGLPLTRALVDGDTGVVTQLWGGRVATPGAVAEAAVAERAARAFLAQHLAVLAPGASIDDFVLASNVAHDGTRTVAFHQTWRGLRVVGGDAAVVIARDAIIAAQSRAVPFIALALGSQIGDTHGAAAATSRAEAWIGSGVHTTARHGRVVLPIVTRDGLRVHLADHVEMRGAQPSWWDVYVGLDGAPLLRASKLRFATGTLAFDAPVRRPSVRQAYPAREVGIRVDGAGATTDADGAFTWPGSGDASVDTSLAGPRIAVRNQAGANATATLTASDGATATWSLATDELGDAQLSAFVHAGIAKAKARALMPSLAWIDQTLEVFVNEGGGACNASSSGDSIHFYAGNAACENTARLADVVYHELGHSLHAQAVIDGIGSFNPALSEGLADFFAANLVDDSALGRGFKFDDTPVRELDPPGFEKVAPDDLTPSPHQSGLVIAGALWDLRRALIAQHGEASGRERAERVFVGLLQRAPNIPGSYLAALIADDDDGELGNGTPNQCAIDLAFARHGLAPASVAIPTIGTPLVDGLTLRVPTTVPVSACAQPRVAAMRVTWRVQGGEDTLALVDEGGTWTGTIPLALEHVAVFYAIDIEWDDGTVQHLPNNPADPEYTLFTGPVTEIWCERFDADPQWTQTQTGTTPAWEWAAPRGLAGDPTAGFTGTNALGTDLTSDGRYAAISEMRLVAPAIDASMYRQVRLQLRRWLTVEDALFDQASIEANGQTLWTNAATSDGTVAHWDREWRFVDHDVTGHATSPIAITWTLTSDDSRSLGGWTIDDVCLVGIDKLARCGDAVVDDGEDCDDPGASTCAADCTRIIEDSCCSVGGTPHGAALLALGVLALLRRRRRR